MVLDCDVHQGNGTASLVVDDLMNSKFLVSEHA